jgi:hypothetical protein
MPADYLSCNENKIIINVEKKMSPPVLNEYKIEFTRLRILQTLFGGPRISPADSDTSASLFSYTIIAILWFWPWILCEILTAAFQNKSVIVPAIIASRKFSQFKIFQMI